MTALGVVLLEVLCCLGLGATALRLLRVADGMDRDEHLVVAFAVGFGLLGWLIFPLGVAGLLAWPWLLALLVAGAAGSVYLWRAGLPTASGRPDAVGWTLIAVIAAVMAMDGAEALAPPVDADTLAYHFNHPRLFLEAGRIEFILRPLDGAIPYLIHMTYLAALGLGGELAATLWTMVSGWAVGAFLYVLCRRHLGRNWSLAVTAVFLTTPAAIYGAGSGQVEMRMALFVLTAAWATARALETGRLRFAVLGGAAAGFYVGAKYLGLLFAAGCGLAVLVQRRWLAHGAAFGAALAVAGFQWYLWNAVHTGDPAFPMFFQWLGRDDMVLWNTTVDTAFKEFWFPWERAVPRSVLWLLLYPLKATLDPPTAFQAGRIGFGPYGLLILPFAALGVWAFRRNIRRSPLLVYAAVTAVFYALWFFTGSSQRIRHILPVLPLVLLCLTVAAQRLTVTAGGLVRPLAVAVAATLCLQVTGQALFSVNAYRYLAGGADRAAFLRDNVLGYDAAVWINAHLKPVDRVLTSERQLLYFLDVPYFFATDVSQAAIDLRGDNTDAAALRRQVAAMGITHALLGRVPTPQGFEYSRPLHRLWEVGCLRVLKSFHMRTTRSRTLPALSSGERTFDVLTLGGRGCAEG